MAQLSFDGIQPVVFGGKECAPKVNAEQRLRLQQLKFETEADNEKADKMLAECFPENEKYVFDFLNKQMTPFEKQQLRAYLISGANGIRILDQAISKMMGDIVEEKDGE